MKKSFFLISLIYSNISFAQEYISHNDKKYKISDIINKCKEQKYENHLFCQKYNKKNNLNTVNKNSISINIGVLSSIKGSSIDYMRKFGSFEYGIYFKTLNINQETPLKGTDYGFQTQYSLMNTNKYKNPLNVFLGVGIGQLQLQSNYLNKTMPKYFATNLFSKIDVSIKKYEHYSIGTNIKLQTTEIYHKDSGFLNLGSSIQMGITIGF